MRGIVEFGHRHRGAALLLAATTLWGLSSASLAHLGSDVGSAAPLVTAGGAVFLWLMTWANEERGALGRYRLRPAVVLGVVEAVNMGQFAVALRLAPTALVVALHLTAPAILVIAGLFTGRLRWGVRPVGVLVLISSAIALSAGSGSRADYPHQTLGLALALGSAVVLAFQLTLATRAARTLPANLGAAVQLTVASVLLGPLAATNPHASPGELLIPLLIGVLVMGPAFSLAWAGLKHLTPVTGSILGLNEAVVAPLLNAVLFGAVPGIVDVLAAGLLLGAVVLAIVTREFAAPRTGSSPDPEADPDPDLNQRVRR